MIDHSKLIRNFDEWKEIVTNTRNLSGCVIEDINFSQEPISWQDFKVKNTTFLGCDFRKDDVVFLIQNGAFLYPKFQNLPYNPYRHKLYSCNELLDGYQYGDDQSSDLKIYKHFETHKYNPPVNEALAQRIHDHSIDVSLRELLGYDQNGMTKKKAVGFMGGHSTGRNTTNFSKVALTAKRISETGYYVTTGGGPGIMEAANLGAYFTGKTDEELYRAIGILSDLDFVKKGDKDYLAKNYIERSQEVRSLYKSNQESLAIPTWFYGHEPSNLFATHIAKYFSNSIREDTLLAICLYGVVYAPGSAGTTQEIFQEAAQNHYGTFGYYSPMIFLGKERYVEETSLYSVMHQLSREKEYNKLLHLTDSAESVVEFIQKNPPIAVKN